MVTPFLGEIRIFTGNFAPLGWVFCQGQLLAISENDALFGLIGTTFGGDGETTFALPKLTGGTFGPAKPPLTWCIAAEGMRPMSMPPKHK